MDKWLKAIVYLIISAFLTRWIPYSSFFRNVDTLIHESGHAVVTLLLSGTVVNISLYEDHSGVTRSYLSGHGGLVLVALAGYVSASFFAWMLFSLYARNRQALGLKIISVIAALALLLFVRNGFGMMWLTGFLVLNGLILFLGKAFLKYYYLLIAFLSLEESVFGPFTLLLVSLRDGGGAGDAALLAGKTSFPSVFWASLFLLIALWCAKRAVQAFVGRGKHRNSQQKRTIHYPIRS